MKQIKIVVEGKEDTQDIIKSLSRIILDLEAGIQSASYYKGNTTQTEAYYLLKDMV